MSVQYVLFAERVKTRVADVCRSVVFRPVGDQSGHIFNMCIMTFGRIGFILKEQKVDVMGAGSVRT